MSINDFRLVTVVLFTLHFIAKLSHKPFVSSTTNILRTDLFPPVLPPPVLLPLDPLHRADDPLPQAVEVPPQRLAQVGVPDGVVHVPVGHGDALGVAVGAQVELVEDEQGREEGEAEEEGERQVGVDQGDQGAGAPGPGHALGHGEAGRDLRIC